MTPPQMKKRPHRAGSSLAVRSARGDRLSGTVDVHTLDGSLPRLHGRTLGTVGTEIGTSPTLDHRGSAYEVTG